MAYSTRQRTAAFSNGSPPMMARRNRVERAQCSKRPNQGPSTGLTPDRKRSSMIKSKKIQDDTVFTLADLPVLALKRVFFYLNVDERVALSQTCRKMLQVETFARKSRCSLNIRADLLFTCKSQLQSVAECMRLTNIFCSMELFEPVLKRSLLPKTGSICCLDKIARVDFGPPDHKCNKVWAAIMDYGGRMMVTESSLRRCFGSVPLASVLELRLHRCYVHFDSLITIGSIFVGLEKMSLSLKGLEFPVQGVDSAERVEEQLVKIVNNWSAIVMTRKKILQSPSVKEMVVYMSTAFPVLEELVLYPQ